MKQREIKFRAWDAHNKVMIEDYCWLGENNHFEAYDLTNNPDCPTHVMQFTGLKDKNGKEIYEGDIVQYILDNPDNLAQTFVEEVSYQGSGFCVDGQCPVDATTDWEVEVIGNIWENPELLKP